MSSSEGFSTLSKEQIQDRLHPLTEQEFAVSTRRRELHVEIDALRRKLVNRTREEGVDVISGEDTRAWPRRQSRVTASEAAVGLGWRGRSRTPSDDETAA